MLSKVTEFLINAIVHPRKKKPKFTTLKTVFNRKDKLMYFHVYMYINLCM